MLYKLISCKVTLGIIAKKKFSSIIFLFRWRPFAVWGNRSVKTCYSFHKDAFLAETKETIEKHWFLTNTQATSPAAQMQSAKEKRIKQVKLSAQHLNMYDVVSNTKNINSPFSFKNKNKNTYMCKCIDKDQDEEN